MSGILGYFSDAPNESLIGLSLAVFLSYYLIEVVKRPRLVCQNGVFREFLEANISLLNQKFWPTLWCFESRLHTIFSSIIRTSILPDIEYRRELLTLSDGGEIGLDWLDGKATEDSPVMVMLPGLTGASQSEYIKCIAHAATRLGIRFVAFNNRGLGGVELKTPRLYCAANHEDLKDALVHIRGLYTNSMITATGVSMGGLILGNYLANAGNESMISAAMIISAPINVFKGTESIEKPFLNSLLSYHLTLNLRRTIEKCEKIQEGPWNLDEVHKSKTVREFDAAFTTKHFGYSDVEHYYSAATLHDKLGSIRVPVLFLNAADDPFQPFDALPIKEIEKTNHVAMLITARGGHIGFMEGLWPTKEGHTHYMARLFSQYFQAIFQYPLILELEKA